MITSVIFLLMGSAINLLVLFLSLFSFVIPHQIPEAITWLFQTMNIFSGLFPIADLVQALLAILTAWIAIWGVRLAIWVLNFIPFVNNMELPSFRPNSRERQGQVVDLRRNYNSDVVDLRKGRKR